MDTGMQILLLLVAVGLVGLLKGKKIYYEYRAFTAWRRGEYAAALGSGPVSTPPPSESSTLSAPPAVIDTRTLPGAGTALLNPPADLRTSLTFIKARATKPYAFPLGWRLTSGGKPDCVYASLVGDVNHIALTGFTDSGKDSWAIQALLSMALTNTPDTLQLAIIDGKGGLSWIGWENKAHVWLMAEQPEDMRPAMDRLKAERERRQQILKAARCEKWEEYTGIDMPLMVVFVSELMLLQDATSKTDLADWLNTELTSARAAGIRYIVSGQTFTRLDTRWRSQIGLYIAGYQPRGDADEPNTSFTTKELRDLGANTDGAAIGMPPSALPVPPTGSGVFTCVQGRTVLTVRAPYLNKEHRLWLLDRLPDRPAAAPRLAPVARPVMASAGDDAMLLQLLQSGQALPIADEVLQTTTTGAIAHQKAIEASERPVLLASSSSTVLSADDDDSSLVVAPTLVPPEEQRRILAAAQSAASRRQLSLKLYEATGGARYTWVQLVCDAAGLLPAKGVAQ
jgi:S-DNA-T family DNA segregation ATPase FtsK/SpoIIIE